MRFPKFFPFRHTEDTESDSDLFRRFFAGEAAAFDAIFKRYHRRIQVYCMKMTGNAGAAEDLAQEVWERLLRLRATRDITYHNPAGLLMTMARNACLDYLKKQRPHDALHELPETSHPRQENHELTRLEELVVLSLQQLPFKQREVLVLNAYSGYRFDEIAAMFGESADAVRMRASRARYHLGQIVVAMLDAEEDEDRHNRSMEGQP